MEAQIGHNQPDMAETATDTARDLSEWMKEHPVIQTEEEARESKVYIDRAKLCVKDLEDERVSKVGPLNEQVKQINEHYRQPRSLVQKVCDELQYRLSTFIRNEEIKRQRAAAEATRLAAEAEAKARAAEAAEREALENADSGEVGVDIAAATGRADQEFAEFQKAQRAAIRAERDTHVKIGGGFSRAVSLKDKEILTVSDPAAVLKAVGATDYIKEAMIKSARAYKKLNGKYPEGITVQIEREI